MEVTDLPNVTDSRAVHLKNAAYPTEMTESGRVMDSREPHSSNA